MACILFMLNTLVYAAETDTVIRADALTAAPGQQVEVPIYLTGNPGIVGACLTVYYDEGLILTGIESGTALPSLTMTKPGDYSDNPIRILWDGTDADNTDGVMAILQFTAPSQPGDYGIRLSYNSGDILNNDLNPISCTLMQGKITVEEQTACEIGITLSEMTSTSAEVMLNNQGSNPATVLYALAIYDTQGRLVSIRSAQEMLSAHGSYPVSISNQNGIDIYELKMFLLDPGTLIPLQAGWSVMPDRQ